MVETADAQKEKIPIELLMKQQLKNDILNICECMCKNIVKEKPKNLASYMLNWLQNKYNYSSSLLKNEEKKELNKLKEDLKEFYDMDEHIHYIESQIKAKKESKIVEKKSKAAPKPKPRLPPEEIIPSDEEDSNNQEEIDNRLDNIEYIKNNIKSEPRPSNFEYLLHNIQDINIQKLDKPPEVFEFIKINLMKSPLFSELSLDILTKCINAMDEKSFPAMTEIVKQGEFSDYFYFIYKGELEGRMGFTIITREGNKKKVEKFDPKLIKVYYSGDYFGELNLIYHIPLRATIKTITETKIFMLDRNVYKKILNISYKEINNKRLLLLKNIPIFATLNDEEFEKLIKTVKESIYYNGETIIREKEYSNKLMIIEEGNCIGKKIQEEGKIPLKIKDYKEKEIIFEEALLKPVKSEESIIANNDIVKIICIDRTSFKNIFGSLEQILMRNLEIYHKYFPILPEIQEESKTNNQIVGAEGENINQENIEQINPINNELDQNKNNQAQELLDNKINGEQDIQINNINNINIEEYIQKINKEKEELKAEYESKLKALNEENNSLKNQIMNRNNNDNNNIVNSQNNNLLNDIINSEINKEIQNNNINNNIDNNRQIINNNSNNQFNQNLNIDTNNNLDINRNSITNDIANFISNDGNLNNQSPNKVEDNKINNPDQNDNINNSTKDFPKFLNQEDIVSSGQQNFNEDDNKKINSIVEEEGGFQSVVNN